MSELLLSSDILESQFGPTSIEILYQHSPERLICTKAVKTGRALEILRVVFSEPGADRFASTHTAVLSGESIGKAFRADGMQIHRAIRASYDYHVSGNLERWFGSAGSDEPATVVDGAILVGPGRTPYANVLEIYSPDVDWPRLSGAPTPGQLEQIRLIDRVLAKTSP